MMNDVFFLDLYFIPSVKSDLVVKQSLQLMEIAGIK